MRSTLALRYFSLKRIGVLFARDAISSLVKSSPFVYIYGVIRVKLRNLFGYRIKQMRFSKSRGNRKGTAGLQPLPVDWQQINAILYAKSFECPTTKLSNVYSGEYSGRREGDMIRLEGRSEDSETDSSSSFFSICFEPFAFFHAGKTLVLFFKTIHFHRKRLLFLLQNQEYFSVLLL